MNQQAYDVASKVAKMPQYLDQTETERSQLSSFCEKCKDLSFDQVASLPNTQRSFLLAHAEKQGFTNDDLEEILQASWEAALNTGAIRLYEGKILFPSFLEHSDADAYLEIVLKPNSEDYKDSRILYVSYIGYVHGFTFEESHPGKALESFAFLNWDKFLNELADTALPEPWDFGRENRFGYRMDILKSYINYTFFRIQQQDKVCISKDSSFAAFNSGLVDSWYDDIFVCFEPNVGETEWRYLGLAAKGNRGLKKRINEEFNPAPQRAEWFDDIHDVLYDPNLPLEIDYEHILFDNIERFPTTWLINSLRGLGMESEMSPATDKGSLAKDDFYEAVIKLIEEDYIVYQDLYSKLERSVVMARKRISWNYKAAIPSYYPLNNSMSFLLPLCLSSPDKADVALVVKLQDSGVYQGVTILTLEMAYKDARLICRPDSDWLNAAIL